MPPALVMKRALPPVAELKKATVLPSWCDGRVAGSTRVVEIDEGAAVEHECRRVRRVVDDARAVEPKAEPAQGERVGGRAVVELKSVEIARSGKRQRRDRRSAERSRCRSAPPAFDVQFAAVLKSAEPGVASHVAFCAAAGAAISAEDASSAARNRARCLNGEKFTPRPLHFKARPRLGAQTPSARRRGLLGAKPIPALWNRVPVAQQRDSRLRVRCADSATGGRGRRFARTLPAHQPLGARPRSP